MNDNEPWFSTLFTTTHTGMDQSKSQPHVFGISSATQVFWPNVYNVNKKDKQCSEWHKDRVSDTQIPPDKQMILCAFSFWHIYPESQKYPKDCCIREWYPIEIMIYIYFVSDLHNHKSLIPWKIHLSHVSFLTLGFPLSPINQLVELPIFTNHPYFFSYIITHVHLLWLRPWKILIMTNQPGYNFHGSRWSPLNLAQTRLAIESTQGRCNQCRPT